MFSATSVVMPQAHAVAYNVGDVFAGIGHGKVNHFDSTGSLIETLDSGTGSTESTGMCFDSAGNLFATMFQANDISKFDNLGGLVNGIWATLLNAHPESCLVTTGNILYAGHADGNGDIVKFDSTGAQLDTYDVAIEDRGSDWIDLAADGCTMRYTSEGSLIKQYDVCTKTQLGNFTTLPSQPCYAHRITGDGGGLVACTNNVYKVDNTGLVTNTYPNPDPSGFLFALNLDPDGTSFWTANYQTGNITRIDIATGSIITKFNGSKETSLAGLAVFGEKCASCDQKVHFMTGGGSVKGTQKVTHGFELFCNTKNGPNNLEVNWGKNNKFHLTSLDTASCTDDASIAPNPPVAGFDTYTGTGTGTYNGVAGATASWTMTDAGEPGVNDTFQIKIKNAGGTTVLDVSGKLQKGNQQAHDEVPPL